MTLSYRLFLLLTLSLFMSCSQGDDIGLSGSYEGLVINQTVQIRDQSVTSFLDTLPITVTINKSQFIAGLCEGSLQKPNSELRISSDDCDCWCQCDPTVDCSGYPLLGEYAVTNYPDSIVMTGEYNQTTLVGNIEHVWIVEKKVVLFR